MRNAVVFTLLAATVLPVFSKPAASGETVVQQEQTVKTTNAVKQLAMQKHFVAVGKPEVPSDTCAHAISGYRALNAARSPCLQGYARHSNGRCYRVVDKPQDGGVVAEHEYRITFRAECVIGGWERKVLYLDRLKTLDFCDEDGGCVDVLERDEEGRAQGASRVCEHGQILDADGKCRKTLVLPKL